MARFCSACGTTNEDDAAFCDNCGQALRRPNAAQPAPTPASTAAPAPVPNPGRPGRPSTKTLLWGGVGTATLAVAIGGGVWAWSFMQHRPPSEAEQTALATQWLTQNKEQLLQKSCLSNFPYQKSPVSVSAWNNDTRAWMDALVAGQVYQSTGTDAYNNQIYEHGPQAGRHIRRNRLCLADAVKLDSTELKPAGEAEQAVLDKTEDGRRFARLSLRYSWDGLPAFATTSPVSDEWPNSMKNTEADLTLYRGDDGWREATDADQRRLRQQIAAIRDQDRPQPSATSSSGSGFDIGRWFSQLFSFGSGPEQVATAFIEAMAAGDVDTALGHLHPQQRSATTDSKIRMAMEMKRQDRSTEREVERVTSEVQNQTDTMANVLVVVHYSDGRQEKERVKLRQHQGTWYVVMN